MRPSILLSLLALLVVGCNSGHIYPERMYLEVLDLANSHEGTGGMRTDVRERMETRYGTVVRWTEEGLVETPEQLLYSALTLSLSDHLDQLMLAQELATAAAEQGEPRGYLAYAIATDKLAFELGEPTQRYGTHVMFTPVLGKFVLHPPVDPLTTDEERASMGVPPLAELRAEVDALNEDETTDVLRERVQKPRRD